MRRVVACALLALGAVRSFAADDSPPPRLVVGRITTLFLSTATESASALVDVPPGIETLHVFASIDGPDGLIVEEGPIGPSGEFTEFIRHEKRSGRLHLVRSDPAPGAHRIVVTGRVNARGAAAVDVEFDQGGLPPIVDLAREGLPGFVRRFRLYVPPHEGVAVLRSAADKESAGGIRVRLRGPRGELGEDTALPVRLAGTESGGMFEVEILHGLPEALARMELYLSRAAGAPTPAPSKPPPLTPGTPVTVFLGGRGSDQADFVLHVPAGATGYRITATADPSDADGHPDPDVYVERGRPVDSPDEDADYLGVERGPTETLHVGGTLGLPPDDYYVHVELVDSESSADVTVTATVVPASSPVASPAPELLLDTWTRGSIHAETATIQWYTVRLPSQATNLAVQIVDATSEVDLLIVDPTTGAVIARSIEFQIDECLSCHPPGDHDGRWLVGVVSRTGAEDDVDYRVAASADRRPELPSDLRLPPFPRATPPNETEAAALAVAEIQVNDGTGSAVSIDPRGYLLTCRHVVIDDETEAPTRGSILVAFPDDLREPPRQAFRAKVVETDADLDLALLRIESDVYGRPVSGSLGLPFIPLGDSDLLRLGDPLTVIGYPGDGSERSRPPVTVSHGVVAGLEAFRHRLLWIKSDAWIAMGHSGGAVINRDGSLVGLVAATLGSRNTMGIIRPVGLLPPSWLEALRIKAPRR